MYRGNYNDFSAPECWSPIPPPAYVPQSPARSFVRQGGLAWFDKGPQEDAARVALRNKETSAVTSHYVVDSREIVKAANTIYERLADDETPPEAA